jgi:hypothetical protein
MLILYSSVYGSRMEKWSVILFKKCHNINLRNITTYEDLYRKGSIVFCKVNKRSVSLFIIFCCHAIFPLFDPGHYVAVIISIHNSSLT